MKDIVYTRKYTDQKGQERKEYILVGYIFEKEDKTSILMKSWINPAALQNEKGEVWLGVYEHKPKEAKTQENAPKSLYKSAETVQAIKNAIEQAKPQQEEDMDTPF